MSAAEARLEAAAALLGEEECEPRAILMALGITSTGKTTAELWGPLLTKLLGGPEELAAIRWAIDIARRMVEGTPTLAEYTGDLKERLDAAHRFLREVADGPPPPAAAGREDLLDCLSCGATIEECDQVCRDTGLTRSCCGRCKVTATHTVAAHRARGTGHRG